MMFQGVPAKTFFEMFWTGWRDRCNSININITEFGVCYTRAVLTIAHAQGRRKKEGRRFTLTCKVRVDFYSKFFYSKFTYSNLQT